MDKHARRPADRLGIFVTVSIVVIIILSSVMGLRISQVFATSTLIPLNMPKQLNSWTSEELPSVSFPLNYSLEPRGSFTISTRLVDTFTPTSVLLFHTEGVMAEVRVEGKLIYVYGSEKTEGICEIASAWHTIRLPDKYHGKTVDITLTAGVLPVDTTLESVHLGTYSHCLVYLFVSGILSLIGGGLTVVLATVLLVLLLITSGRFGMPEDGAAYAFFVLLVGIDIMVTSGMEQFLFHSADMTQLISVLTHILQPLPLLYSAAILTRRSKLLGTITRVACIVAIILTAAILVLMSYGVIVYEETSAVLACFRVIFCVFAVLACFVGKQGQRSFASLCSALIIVVAMIADMVLLHVFVSSGNITEHIAPLCMILWFVAIIQGYMSAVAEKTALQSELEIQRLNTMMKQIKPHFIYNTLNTIDAQILINPSEARDTLQSFAKYLRANIDSVTTAECISLSQEISIVENYLNIEHTRFGTKLKTNIDISPDTDMSLPLPPLSLQPIVENAIKHGICMRAKGGTMTLTVTRSSGSHCIMIKDDGVGFDTNSAPNKSDDHVSMGLESVKLRLSIMCEASMTINSTPDVGTLVTIMIPDRRKK